MKKPILLVFILSLAFTLSSYACSCSIFDTVTSQYQKADFVATLKIIKIYKNFPDTNQYYKADVEIIDLYKGKTLRSIYILGNNGGSIYNSCGTFIEEGETRLIIGSFEGNMITTYLCTSFYKPNEVNYKNNRIAERLTLLKKHVKNNSISFINEMTIYPYDFKQNYKPELINYFSLVKVIINRNGLIKQVKFITNDSDTLKKAYLDYFNNIINWTNRLKKISNKNNSENITVVFEIKPYTSLKEKGS